MAHQVQQLRNRQKTMHGTTNLTKHVPKEALLRPDVFLVITAECIWPVFSFWQQKQLCELAKEFCYTELGVQGPLIQVYGDMLPPSDFLIIVPRTREVPDMITAASKFIHACQKLWALNVQLQLGQLAVFDTSGILYTMLQCWQTSQNDGFIVHNTTQDNTLLQIRSSLGSASNPTAALTLQHGAASTCLIGQSQCSSLPIYLQKMRLCLPL